ncbi:hypothetical protein KC323_g4166 [Hortaea werneckii]|nr:hypothetical protein KC323_g4166 [Hortaea werneckii]
MCVLEDCVSNINAAGNELMTPAINMAVKRCSNLAEQLAFRQVEVDRVGRVRKVIYKLNAWATLRSQYADFQDRVSFIHHLTQDLALRNLQREQQTLLQTSFRHNGLLNELLGRERARSSTAGRTAHESPQSDISSFTIDPRSEADAVAIRRELLLKDIASDLVSSASPSLVMGTIAVAHESKPRYVPVKAKYDTGADVNFMPIAFLEKHGLSSMQEELVEETPGDNVFIGLNNEEYIVLSTVTLHWCASNMHPHCIAIAAQTPKFLEWKKND